MAAGCVCQGHDVIGHLVGDVDAADFLLCLYQLLSVCHRMDEIEGNAVSQLPKHLPFLRGLGIAHADADEKTVHLCRRKAESALGFHRILGGQNDERSGQGKAFTVNGDLPLLHGLQQGGLGAGNGTVDLIGQQQVGHDRALPQLEIPGFLVVNPHADDVAGQHVGDELDAPGAAAQGDGDGLHQRGLSHAGEIVQQNMAVG